MENGQYKPSQYMIGLMQLVKKYGNGEITEEEYMQKKKELEAQKRASESDNISEFIKRNNDSELIAILANGQETDEEPDPTLSYQPLHLKKRKKIDNHNSPEENKETWIISKG